MTFIVRFTFYFLRRAFKSNPIHLPAHLLSETHIHILLLYTWSQETRRVAQIQDRLPHQSI